MPKRCCFGMCNTDDRYPERLVGGIKFIPFPKPKTNKEKCLRWISLSGQPHEQLNVDRVTRHTYVCSKHFKNGLGPCDEFPDPFPANPYSPKPKPSKTSPSKRPKLETQGASISNQSLPSSGQVEDGNTSEYLTESFTFASGWDNFAHTEMQYHLSANQNLISEESTEQIVMATHSEKNTVEDDDDDIILIMEENKPALQPKPNDSGELELKTNFCQDVKEQIKATKKQIELTETEIKFMSRELKSMESEIGDVVYERLKFLVENPDSRVLLDVDEDTVIDIITEQLSEMGVLEHLSRSRSRVIQEKLSVLEKANQSVSKMLLQCHTRLKTYGQALTEESDIVSEEIAKYEKILSSSTINVDDDEEMQNDSDDDVRIVEDPLTQAGSSGSLPLSPQSQLSASRQQRVSQSQDNLRPNMSSAFNAEIPSIEQLRSQFASVINSQMPGLLTSLTAQQDSISIPHPVQRINWHSDPNAWPRLKAGDKVLAKKFNDVWYAGVILDVSATGDQEWKCRVKFDGKGLKYVTGKHVAYKESINSIVRVGTRIVALYKEEDAPSTFYAGIIAEAPSMKNNKRFLVFFDDGYAQYCQASEIHKVYMQSENVWEDIHPDTSSFIKEYLDIYPERPMVRLAKGQVVRTEWNGKWWTAKVLEIDASLVKMVFQSDRRTEWIYRGSTRLEPLFRALTNANAIKAAGSSRGRRLNLSMKPSNAHNKPSVEYTRNVMEEDRSASTSTASSSTSKPKATGSTTSKAKSTEPSKKRSNMAKKSTGGNPDAKATMSMSKSTPWQAPWLKYQRKATPEQKKGVSSLHYDPGQDIPKNRAVLPTAGARKSSSDYASLLQEKLAKSLEQMEYDEEKAMGKRMDLHIDTKGRQRTDFVPHTCSPDCVKDTDDDPVKFRGQSPLLIPLNCSWERHICKARPTVKRFVLYRTPCGRRVRSIEEVDKYLQVTDSQLTIDLFTFDHHCHVCTEFVPVKTFCDIKDLSYGKENYPVSCVNGLDRQYPDYLEYSSFRIPTKNVHLNLDEEFLACCDCTDNCRDRSKCACQQLTIENTSCVGPVDPTAGYHYRRLPEPLFTGIYECNSRCACDKRCHNRVAQLGLRTRLQVFKTEKKGWGLRSLDDISKGSFICIYAGQLLTDKGANEDGKQYGDEYLAELDFIEVVEGQKEGYESDVEFSDDQDDKSYIASKDSDDSDFSMSSPLEELGERRSSRRKKTKDQSQESATTVRGPKTEEESKSESKPTSVSNCINISDDDDVDEADGGGSKDAEMKEDHVSEEKKQPSSNDSKKEEGSPNSADSSKKTGDVHRRARKSTGGSRLNLSISVKSQEASSEKAIESLPTSTSGRSTGRYNIKGGLTDVGVTTATGWRKLCTTHNRNVYESKSEKKIERAPARSYFRDNTECYIMDAKSMGNLGRYLNHSCTPNVFVQNIFVDTHDLRFPWVSFFAGQHIRAGTELTWDYNYEVGSVPNKILYCYCGSSLCRGRLL